MSTRRWLPFLIVVVALFGCRRSSSGTAAPDLPLLVAATVLGGGNVLLDPFSTTALALGVLTLRNDLAVGTVDGDIDFRVVSESGIECDTPEVTLAPGEERLVQVATTLAVAAILTVQVYARYRRGGDERTFPVTWTNIAAASRALALVTLLSPNVLPALWFGSAMLAPFGVPTRNSNPLLELLVPALAQDVRLYGALIAFFTLAQLEALYGSTDGGLDGAVFPVGQGPEGFTIAATPSAPLAEGEYCIFWASVSADIPLADPARLYQYAFVVDTDANPANNYQPIPAFADDYFGGTDRWYELNYAPASGWTLRRRVVGAGNSITTQPSGARAIFSGDTLLLMVPRSEFVLANPPFRVTTFAHSGDFGQNPPYDWSGDPTPTVAEGLRSWQ